jgi:hypothetical protein
MRSPEIGQAPRINPCCLNASASGDYGWRNIGLTWLGTTGTSCDLSSLICAADAEAIAKAKRLVADHDVELWSGKRFVIRLEVTTK